MEKLSIKSFDESIEYLKLIEDEMIRCLSIVLIIGLIGNMFSYIVFNDKEYRLSGISLLFRSASIFNIIVLIYGIGVSFYSVNNINPEKSSFIFCKIRLYIRHILLMIVRSYIVLACFGSFCLTSSKLVYRSLFEIRYVRWYVGIIPLLWPLIALHMPLLTNLNKNKCRNVDQYVLIFGIYFFTIVGIIPLLLMILFILLTINNLRVINRRIRPSVVNGNSMKLKSRDQQFIRMLLSLVIMYLITNLIYPLNVLYMSLTDSSIKNEKRVRIESLIITITSNYILYINNISPFFLFFISSKSFRRSFYRFYYKFIHFLRLKITLN